MELTNKDKANIIAAFETQQPYIFLCIYDNWKLDFRHKAVCELFDYLVEHSDINKFIPAYSELKTDEEKYNFCERFKKRY